MRLSQPRRWLARTCCLQFGQTKTLQRTGALRRCEHLSQEANSPSSKKLLAAASSSPACRLAYSTSKVNEETERRNAVFCCINYNMHSPWSAAEQVRLPAAWGTSVEPSAQRGSRHLNSESWRLSFVGGVSGPSQRCHLAGEERFGGHLALPRASLRSSLRSHRAHHSRPQAWISLLEPVTTQIWCCAALARNVSFCPPVISRRHLIELAANHFHSISRGALLFCLPPLSQQDENVRAMELW
eukprot:SAG31_NODE_9212_length_1315_cov_1.666118_1_plen_242_part_00